MSKEDYLREYESSEAAGRVADAGTIRESRSISTAAQIIRCLLDFRDKGSWEVMLASRVEKELSRHVRGIFRKECRACGFPWPCPTVRILNGEE